MNTPKQTNHPEQLVQNPGSLSQEEISLRQLSALPATAERDEKIKVHGEAQEDMMEEEVQKAQKVLSNEKLGLWLGSQALLYRNSSDVFNFMRIQKDKLEKEKTSNKEQREAHKAVGGIISFIKQTGLKIDTVLESVPRAIVTVGKGIASVDEKVTRTLTLNPLRAQLESMRRSNNRIKPLLQSRGVDTSNTKNLYADLKGKNIQNERTANAILSKGFVANTEKINAVESFMLKAHVRQEADVYGRNKFAQLDMRLDSLSQTIAIKDRNSTATPVLVPYSFDSRGYMIFDGEISLLRAKEKAATKAPLVPKKAPTPTIEQNNIIPERKDIPNLLERSGIITRFIKDKEHAFFVPKDENEDFMNGRTDTLVLRHGERPMEKTVLKMKVQKRVLQNGDSISVFMAQKVNFRKDQVQNTEPFQFSELDSSGKMQWSKEKRTQLFLKHYEFQPITKEELKNVSTNLSQQYMQNQPQGAAPVKIILHEEVLNRKDTPFAATPVQHTAEVITSQGKKTFQIVHDTEGKLTLLEEITDEKNVPENQLASIVVLGGKKYAQVTLSNTPSDQTIPPTNIPQSIAA